MDATIEMDPPQLHMHFELLVSAGMFAIIDFDAPGAHGAAVTGMQGIGVKTPSAAEVAAATIGLERLMHMPNGGMLTMGLLSMMFAAGIFPAMTLLVGNTLSALGATPNEHIIIEPVLTIWGMNRISHREP